MMNNVRKLSKNEILKAMECYDRYPYMPFWWIVREISQNKYGIDRLNYEFKYGYDNPEKGHFHESYSPSKELKDIYRYMQNYIDNKNYNRPHNTSLSMQDCVISSCKQGENSYLNFAEYVNRGNFEQALKERDYWRNARRFIDQYIPKEAENGTWQETNIHYARRFGRAAYKYVGDIIASNNMSSSDPSAIAMHGTISGIIAKMCGKYYIQGEVLGEINKAIVAKIYENRKTIGFSDKDVINFSRRLGEYLGKALGLGENLGGEIAEMATRWNQTGEHNKNLLENISSDKIKKVSVINYRMNGQYKVTHSSVLVTVDDGSGRDIMLEVGYGPIDEAGFAQILAGKAKGQLTIKERQNSDFENMTSSRTEHTLKNLTNERKDSFSNNLKNLFNTTPSLGAMQKQFKGNEYIATSNDVNYDAFSNNCATTIIDLVKNSFGLDYTSNGGGNLPIAFGDRLNNAKNDWDTRYVEGLLGKKINQQYAYEA